MKLLAFVTIFAFHLCPKAQVLIFEIPAQKKDLKTGETATINKNENYEIKEGEISLFQFDKQIPLLVISPKSDKQEIKVANVDFKDSFQDYIQQKTNEAVENTVSEIKKIELLIKRNDLSGAQGRIASLKLKYPQISQVLFLSGTISYLTGNKTIALEDLKRGLEINPNDESAKSLIKKIEGSSQ